MFHSIKLQVLLQLEPTLCDIISKKYQVCIHGLSVDSNKLTFEGSPHNISLACRDIENSLSSVNSFVLPDIPDGLIKAAMNVAKKENICVVVVNDGVHMVLCSMSSSDLEKGKRLFTRKPYENKVALKGNLFAVDSLRDIASTNFVHITVYGDTVTLQGFDKEEVQSLRKKIVSVVNKDVPLMVSSEEKAYICMKLKMSSLSVPGVVLRDGKLYVPAEHESSLKAIVPRYFSTIALPCDRRNLTLIEQHLLKPGEIEWVELSTSDQSIAVKNKKKPVHELKLVLYSHNNLVLENVCSSLKVNTICCIFCIASTSVIYM